MFKLHHRNQDANNPTNTAPPKKKAQMKGT